MSKYHLFIIIPVICAACAWLGCGYLFQAGVSGCCAALLLSIPNAVVKKTVWLVIVSFLFSIGGDWFLSHMKHIPAGFIYGVILFLRHMRVILYFA